MEIYQERVNWRDIFVDSLVTSKCTGTIFLGV
jgi:hypothetical protein